MTVASSSAQSFTILTEDDGIPGSKFEKEPEEYTVEHLRTFALIVLCATLLRR